MKLTHKDIASGRINLPRGLYAQVTIDSDTDLGLPWVEHDGHGIISGWENRDKRAGEKILHSDGRSKLFYDVEATMELARKDGWGLGEDEKAHLAKRLGRVPTKGDITAESVARDFDYCRGFARGDWQWMRYHVEIFDRDGQEVGTDSCCGFDGDTPYFRGEIADAIDRILSDYRIQRRQEAKAARIENQERAHWEARDTVTI